MGSFLLRRFVDLFVIYSLLIISRNHSNTFSLLDLKNKRSKVKFWSKGYLWWYQDFARFRQVAVHYLYLVPTRRWHSSSWATKFGRLSFITQSSSPEHFHQFRAFAHSVAFSWRQEDGLKLLDNALMTKQYLTRRSNWNFCRRSKTSVLRVEWPENKGWENSTQMFLKSFLSKLGQVDF